MFDANNDKILVQYWLFIGKEKLLNKEVWLKKKFFFGKLLRFCSIFAFKASIYMIFPAPNEDINLKFLCVNIWLQFYKRLHRNKLWKRGVIDWYVSNCFIFFFFLWSLCVYIYFVIKLKHFFGNTIFMHVLI